jgi:penicillin-binding protein 2
MTMARTLTEQRLITRRALIFGGIQLAGGLGLLSRLFYLQFVRGDTFMTQAEGNRIKVQLLVPARGEMVDRNGLLLAGNDINYRLLLERARPKQALKTFDRLAKLFNWSPAKVKRLRAKIHPKRPAEPLLLLNYVPWDKVTQIEFHLLELPGVVIDEGRWRNYPYGDKAAHLLGYVGKVSSKERKANPSALLRQPDMKIGKGGVETLFEDRLRGSAGLRHLEVNVHGRVVRALKETAASKGETLPLSIDARLQAFAAKRLGKQSGAVVVMDIHSGEILSLVSTPAFDPNTFSRGISNAYWKELLANEKNPLLNKAIAGQYPPGSAFKMLVGLAALKKGVITPHSRVFCPGHFFLGKHRFNCWKVGGHGAMNYREALRESCDTFFYTVAKMAGIEAIAQMANEYGLGASSGLGLRGEKSGLIPTPAWKRRVRGRSWNPGETINAAIGQGDVLATPLQMAVMVARLANGGQKVTPRLTIPEPNEIQAFEQVDIDPIFQAEMMKGMQMVTNNPRGTAYRSGLRDPAFAFGGKTGTSQVRRIIIRGQNQANIPWKYRHHAWFVGYGPIISPRIAISVLIEHGGGGSSAAAPVARDIIHKAMQLMAGDAASSPSVLLKAPFDA